MSHLCSHSYTILRTGGFWWPEKLKVNFKKNAHTDDTVPQMLLFIFFHEVLAKKKKSSVGGRSFTKIEHDSPQRPDTCLVCPQLKPAE